MASARWKPNVTAAAVIEQDGFFLLVEEHTAEGLRLNTPAGHIDPGESPAEACAREALEETGHTFRPTALVGIYMARTRPRKDRDVTYLRFAFAGSLGPRQPGRALDTGIERTLWLSPTRSAPALRATAARCCCAASRITWPADGTRWT